MNFVRILFSFRGRINRARYLAVQLALIAFWLFVLPRLPLYFSSEDQALFFGAMTVIAMIWINAATTAKRLHDRNRSGWWALAILVVDRLSYVYYGMMLGLSFGVDISIAEQLLLALSACALSLLQMSIIIELFFLIGTDGKNRFGSDPTRGAPDSPTDSRPQQDRVPDFLLRRAASAHP
jgi:uncharacterized membrane protein YhaH (DUF805 family)